MFNVPGQMLNACFAGFGLAYVVDDTGQRPVDAGLLVRVLEDWCAPFSGDHLMTSAAGSNRQHSTC